MKRRVTMKNAERKGMKSQKMSLVRASISFPPDLYENLEEIAQQKKVSLAWVVRDAAERYVADEIGQGGKGQQTGTAAKLTRRAT
jgi:metal-responsive CopG/Arc/MetJ family transcriptional regulator